MIGENPSIASRTLDTHFSSRNCAVVLLHTRHTQDTCKLFKGRHDDSSAPLAVLLHDAFIRIHLRRHAAAPQRAAAACLALPSKSRLGDILGPTGTAPCQ